MPQNLKKGQILIVKVPPFFDQEYFYEVMGAGGKVIRAALYRSPKVKKHWTMEEYALLTAHGMIRIANNADLEQLADTTTNATTNGTTDAISDVDDQSAKGSGDTTGPPLM